MMLPIALFTSQTAALLRLSAPTVITGPPTHSV